MLKISAAFTAGVLLVLFTGASESLAAMSLAGSIMAMARMVRSADFERELILLSFFLAGIFCHCSAGLCGVSASESLQALASEALGRMEKVIDAVPLEGEESHPLLKALLCGDRSFLGRDTIAAFRSSGASHILALSGLHLGIIYMVIKKVLGIMGNSPAAWTGRSILCIACCGLYAFITGASASIVRAFLFITLRETGSLFPGRSHSPETIYCTALTIHLALSPGAIESAGFQLSYLAMAGIYTLFPVIREWYPSGKGRDPLRKIWEMASLSISCQLFTAPAAWFHFHTFPLYFLLTNLIALPLTEALIISGLGSIMISILPLPSALSSPAYRLTDLLASLLTSSLTTIASF